MVTGPIYTRAEVARWLGVSPSTVKRWHIWGGEIGFSGLARLFLISEAADGKPRHWERHIGDLLDAIDFLGLYQPVVWAVFKAHRIYPCRGVCISPGVQYGRPRLAGRGIRTATIADRRRSGETAAEIAAAFEIGEDEVRRALAFEGAEPC